MEARILLGEASAEIRDLRRKNELMRARLEMFDSMITLLHTEPARQSQGMSPDVVYAIEKFLKDNEHNPQV